MKTNIMMRLVMAAAVCAFCAGIGVAQQQEFRALVGPVTVGPARATTPLSVPFITWGGDMATFYANGGLTTKAGTLFNRAGLNLQLEAGDDFVQQVRNYMSGKTPFLRGTFRMIGMASGVIASDPRTQGVVIMQMTWSAGDHMVGRSTIEMPLSQNLAGKTIVLQQGGPHVGMLDDLLNDVKLNWSDINVIWAADLTATDNSPATMFAKNENIDACFVITPDMVALSGGLEETGTGFGGTVKGARVVATTERRRGSIADVYICRKDFFDQNRDLVQKFVNVYLRACEEVSQIKAGDRAKYDALLELTQNIYGKEVIPTTADADGLLADCQFVLYPGNHKFFKVDSSISFPRFADKSVDLAQKLGYISTKPKLPLLPGWEVYNMSYIKNGLIDTSEPVRIREVERLASIGTDRTLVSFSIRFLANEPTFTISRYRDDFENVLKMSEAYMGAAFIIRGHSDPGAAIGELLTVGEAKGLIEKTGTMGAWVYEYKGRKIDINDTATMMKLINSGEFSGSGIVDEYGVSVDPKLTAQVALNLSLQRAESVRQALIDYSKQQGRPLLEDQLQAIGVGIVEPKVPFPQTEEEMERNMRVEFRLVRRIAERRQGDK